MADHSEFAAGQQRGRLTRERRESFVADEIDATKNGEESRPRCGASPHHGRVPRRQLPDADRPALRGREARDRPASPIGGGDFVTCGIPLPPRVTFRPLSGHFVTRGVRGLSRVTFLPVGVGHRRPRWRTHTATRPRDPALLHSRDALETRRDRITPGRARPLAPYPTPTSASPCGGAVGPASDRGRPASSPTNDESDRRPPPTSSIVPTRTRFMWRMNASASIQNSSTSGQSTPRRQ